MPIKGLSGGHAGAMVQETIPREKDHKLAPLQHL